jgi:hypoxanthine phosphoribosyltransferase
MSGDALPMSEWLKSADMLYERATLEATIARMGSDITRTLDGDRALFLTVMNGGMFFAPELAFAIDCDLQFDYVHATRYGNATVGSEIEWLHKPQARMSDRSVILVDDILDEGVTLKALRDFCFDEGAQRVLIAVLCMKRHERRVPGLEADFVGVEVPDRFVFGYGLDARGHGRNAPGIYALREEDGT